MAMELTRRGILTGRRARPDFIAPPWAVAREDYIARCTGCGDCVSACPEGVIILRDGVAQMDFSNGGCDFCGDCADACGDGAISRLLRETQGDRLPLHADMGSSCIAFNGITCRLCEEACEVRAIRFVTTVGFKSVPLVDDQACTGCGFCQAVCPVKAVDLRPVPVEEEMS